MKWKQSRYYRFLRKVVQIFSKTRKTVWTEPYNGAPSIFVCNHDRAWGPIAMCAYFELKDTSRPWINAQVLSAKEIPEYVRHDYWWKQDKWYTKIFNYTLVYLVSIILPPILRGSGCIPVYHDTRVMSTLKGSVNALKEGMNIILFPEHPTGYCEYDDEIVTGFVSIGRLFYRRTKQCLSFYPTFITWDNGVIRVGEPVVYDPEMDTDEFADKVSKAVETFYRSCEAEYGIE